MSDLSLTKQTADSLAAKLEAAGYAKHEKRKYNRFSKEKGDTAFIHHSLKIIRARKNTEAESIMKGMFGEPNGKAFTKTLRSWFFNGYAGKGGTTV